MESSCENDTRKYRSRRFDVEIESDIDPSGFVLIEACM